MRYSTVFMLDVHAIYVYMFACVQHRSVEASCVLCALRFRVRFVLLHNVITFIVINTHISFVFNLTQSPEHTFRDGGGGTSRARFEELQKKL